VAEELGRGKSNTSARCRAQGGATAVECGCSFLPYFQTESSGDSVFWASCSPIHFWNCSAVSIVT